jgi:hypothetical protein
VAGVGVEVKVEVGVMVEIEVGVMVGVMVAVVVVVGAVVVVMVEVGVMVGPGVVVMVGVGVEVASRLEFHDRGVKMSQLYSHMSKARLSNGKTPRTLQEARGPYVEWHIDRRTPLEKAKKWVVGVCLGVAGVILWALHYA